MEGDETAKVRTVQRENSANSEKVTDPKTEKLTLNLKWHVLRKKTGCGPINVL